MTDDNELTVDVGTDTIDELQETEEPLETAISIASDLPAGAVPMAGGTVLLLSAIRSLARGNRRGILTAIGGAGLLRYGLSKRRASDRSTFEPNTDEIEGGTEGKESSDAAHAAASRPDSGRESQIDAEGEIDDSAQLGDEGDTGSRIEFTTDAEESEPRSKPGTEGEDDPRRDTDDESVKIDVSDSAMAEEMSEATGPDPEQAQPTQTDSIEPEETPEEDASEMQVEPDEGNDEAGNNDEADK